MNVNKQMLFSFDLLCMFTQFSPKTLFVIWEFDHIKSKSTLSKSCKVIYVVEAVALGWYIAYATITLANQQY